MVETQRRDYRADWLVHDIGRIEVSTDTALEDSVVTSLPLELKKCNHCYDLEESQVDIFANDCVEDGFAVLHNMLFFGEFLVHSDSLPKCVDVW